MGNGQSLKLAASYKSLFQRNPFGKNQSIKKTTPSKMKKQGIYYIIIFLFIILMGCTQNKNSTHNKSLPDHLDSSKITISSLPNAQDSMKTINLKLGEETIIQLKELEGYTWYYEVKPDWIISMTEEYDAPNKSGNKSEATDIDKSTKVFKIKTLKKGEASIRFYEIHAWEQKSKPIDEKLYTVKIE